MIQPIVGYGSQILRQNCQMADNDEIAREAIINIEETMNSLRTAVGLAAPQINVDLRIFGAKMQGIPEIVINPMILKRRSNYSVEEGCLSLPGISSTGVKRDDIIDVEYFNKDFNKVKKRLRGFDSIIFQHEYDHLCGILYIDRLDDKKLDEIRDKLDPIEKAPVKTYYDMIWPDINILTKKS